jgi:hypothetical protein
MVAMVGRIVAIIVIFLATSFGWGALGLVTDARTRASRADLHAAVGDLWGSAHCQQAPEVFALLPRDEAEGLLGQATETPGSASAEQVPDMPGAVGDDTSDRELPRWVRVPVELTSTDARASFEMDYRKKGLLWFSTYNVDFAGTWTARNPYDVARDLVISFCFPAREGVYDAFLFTVNGEEALATRTDNGMETKVPVAPGEEVTFTVSYRSRGLGSWRYEFGHGVAQVRDFSLTLETDFTDIDFPPRTLSPTSKVETASGWRLHWDYENLISGFAVGLQMPEKLNPGPLASRISFFAPVSLLFFFFVIFILGVLRGVHLHPMHYFFLAGAFFSFHLLFAYLADHLDVHLAFLVSSAVSVGLVVSYLRIVAGTRFAFVEAGLAQLLYLVLFSYTHFLEGYTGLTVTIGAVLTLFVLMQTTARIDWDEVFDSRKPAPPTPP